MIKDINDLNFSKEMNLFITNVSSYYTDMCKELEVHAPFTEWINDA